MKHPMFRPVAALAALACLAALGMHAASADSKPRGKAAMPEFEKVVDMPYADTPDPRQRLDLYLPLPGKAPKKGAPPLFMFIHGGAWTSGDKSEYEHIGRYMTRRGIACAVINYRLTTRDPKDSVQHPVHTQDGAAAFAWLRSSAREYGYNPERIVIGGHSAGAHMAALLALDGSYLAAVGEESAHIRGIVGMQGIYDVPHLAEVWGTYPEWFLNAAFGLDRGLWAQASPQNHNALPAGRPWLIIHSPQDELVDAGQSERFVEHLKNLGAKVLYEKPKSEHHFAVVQNLGKDRDRIGALVADFILKN